MERLIYINKKNNMAARTECNKVRHNSILSDMTRPRISNPTLSRQYTEIGTDRQISVETARHSDIHDFIKTIQAYGQAFRQTQLYYDSKQTSVTGYCLCYFSILVISP